MVAIHLEQIDGSFSSFRQADDNGPINGPIEMIISVALLWVEKLNLGSISQFSMGSVGFKTIARRTSEAEILKNRQSITRNWNDMFDLERNDGQGFRSFAVGTAAFKRVSNPPP